MEACTNELQRTRTHLWLLQRLPRGGPYGMQGGEPEHDP